MTPRDHHREIAKLLDSLTGAYRLWNVFEAWAECTTLALTNATTPAGTPAHQAREERYERLITPDPARREVFPQILAHLIEALTLEPHDCLGVLFHEQELASSDMGQFFTPFDVSRVIAKAILGDAAAARDLITKRGFITLQEPAVGAGGMVIAFAEAMRDAGLNPQTQLHATAIDLDATAAHMAYIQLSLLGIPASVYIGNTLTLKMRERYDTPAHVLGLWDYKLRRTETEADVESPATISPPPRAPGLLAQPSLFEVAS